MYYMASRIELDFSPTIVSRPPYIDDDGDLSEARIELHPFGRRRADTLSLVLTVDEADQLARRLWHAVSEARESRYSGEG